MVKRIVALALVLVVASAAPAIAQQYPPADNSLVISDTTPTPGQTITVTARTCPPGSEGTISLESGEVVLGAGQADAEGVLTLDVTIPDDTALGEHTLVARCGSLELSGRIVVVAPAAAGAEGGPPSGSLPRTGSDSSLPLAQIGLGLLAAGGIVTAVATKRRKVAAGA